MGGPLSGVRIVDMTSVLMGPYATQILGDLGADVIKVEAPSGDTVRGIVPMRHAGMGAIFLNVNRSKRSLVLDLKQPEGRQVLLDLARTADVLIYNVRPQAMARLGLSYEAVAEVNPRIIYVGAFGYGQDGPYAAKPAYDDLIQGAIGIPSLIAQVGDGVPRYVPITLVDRTVGLAAVNAVTAALYARERTGLGQRVDVPMFETMAQLVLGDHLQGATFVPPEGPTGYARLLARERQPYRTKDGYVSTLIYNDKQWRAFFALIGRPEVIAEDPRFADISTRTRHIGELYALVAEEMAKRTTAEWLEGLEAADIPVMPLNDLESLIADPHLAATGFFREEEHPSEGRIRTMTVPSRWSRTQPEPERPAPRLGEHSVLILKELGYDAARIDALLAAGVTRDAADLSSADLPTADLPAAGQKEDMP